MPVLKVKADVEIPRVPNFLLTTGGQKLPVSAVPDDDLRGLAKAWGEKLVANAKRQRNLPDDVKDKEVAVSS